MQIRPFAELEAFARAEYKRAWAKVPPPKVVNVAAVLAFNAPREFQWGGVGYRAPPLSFAAGVRLQVAANALRDVREAQAPPEVVRAVVRTAARLIVHAMPPRRRPRWLLRRALAAALWAASLADLEGLARWLLHVPDAGAAAPPSDKPITVDLMDNLVDYARQMPSTWLDSTTGFPKSWAHYQYGVRHLARAAARTDLRLATATRLGQVDQKSWRDYSTDQRAAAGW